MNEENTSIEKQDKILFICAFGQSRSRYFAERMMELGYKSVFCGHDSYSDIQVKDQLISWADAVVILDEYFVKSAYWMYVKRTELMRNKKIIKYFIEDEPVYFEEKLCLFKIDYLDKYKPKSL